MCRKTYVRTVSIQRHASLSEEQGKRGTCTERKKDGRVSTGKRVFRRAAIAAAKGGGSKQESLGRHEMKQTKMGLPGEK